MFTVEIYKKDLRYKAGEFLIAKQDHNTQNLEMLTRAINAAWPNHLGYRFEIHETFVEKVNAMTGEKFQERYDTPWSCSPSSETYWSN